MNSIHHILQQLSNGVLSLTEVRAQVARLAQLPDQHSAHLIAAIHSAVAAGGLNHEAARALLETIANTTEHTQMPGTAVPTAVGKTQVRPALPATDATVRPYSADPDATSAMARMGASSDRTATVGARGVHAPTAARTLHAPQAPLDPAQVAHTWRDQPEVIENTQAMASRLVASLDEPVIHGELQPGMLIKHRFLLDTLIGKGGMGLVFAAIDRRKQEAQDPNPRVALKILNADFKRHPQSFIALQREARKAQTLAHPNVVTVFDFDRDGDAVYMTMELLQGRSLEAIVRETRSKGIGRDLALPIIRGIAEGLAYAHRKGIVHSDLKPGNVFITPDNTPKILDFGIARAVPNPQSGEMPDLFDAGSLGAYTEAYATSEMVNGIDPHPADDMYALGIIGYELLTGFHPFQRHSAPNARRLGIRPAPLKGVSRKEASALERCLSFERKDRPADAAEFLKLFRGVSTLQKLSVSATAVLALTAGYFWYQSYLETRPAVPFSSLPATTQLQFTSFMKQGDEEWGFFERDQNIAALQAAAEQYANAYELHPRNHEAVRGLKRSADALLSAVKSDADRREAAAFLQNQSEYYRQYPPVVDAAK